MSLTPVIRGQALVVLSICLKWVGVPSVLWETQIHFAFFCFLPWTRSTWFMNRAVVCQESAGESESWERAAGTRFPLPPCFAHETGVTHGWCLASHGSVAPFLAHQLAAWVVSANLGEGNLHYQSEETELGVGNGSRLCLVLEWCISNL